MEGWNTTLTMAPSKDYKTSESIYGKAQLLNNGFETKSCLRAIDLQGAIDIFRYYPIPMLGLITAILMCYIHLLYTMKFK